MTDDNLAANYCCRWVQSWRFDPLTTAKTSRPVSETRTLIRGTVHALTLESPPLEGAAVAGCSQSNDINTLWRGMGVSASGVAKNTSTWFLIPSPPRRTLLAHMSCLVHAPDTQPGHVSESARPPPTSFSLRVARAHVLTAEAVDNGRRPTTKPHQPLSKPRSTTCCIVRHRR